MAYLEVALRGFRRLCTRLGGWALGKKPISLNDLRNEAPADLLKIWADVLRITSQKREKTGTSLGRPSDLHLSTRLVVLSTIALLGFIAAGIFGGCTIYFQNKSTENALRVSQSRVDSASKAQAAILIMGKAQAQLVAAADFGERRIDAVLAIKASSTLDESIQLLQQDLENSAEVAELSRLLQEIAPAKMRVIRAVSVNDTAGARSELQGMQLDMTRIEQISRQLVKEENERLLAAVVKQGEQARLTLRVLGFLAMGCIVLGMVVTRRLLAQQSQIEERTAEAVLANARLTDEMREREQTQQELDVQNAKRSARADLLTMMGKLLQNSDNMAEAVSIALGLAPKIFGDFPGALILLNASTSFLEVAGTWGDCDLPATANFDTKSCWALRTGQRHSVDAGDQTARCPHAISTKNSYLCIPIMSQAGAVGLLHLQSFTSARQPFESDLLLSGTFAEQLGLSISNLKLQEALRHQSTRDALTGLFNRRHLEESLECEMRRAARATDPVGIVMFDLDHFKTFNDTFGHAAGDSVLREMGTLLSRNARAEDIPCRFGGEEFFIILPGTTFEGARSWAERLRSKVRELIVFHQGKSVGIITISAGVAAFPVHGLSVKEVIAAADGALYRAKKDGRDRVVVADLVINIDSAVATASSVAVSGR